MPEVTDPRLLSKLNNTASRGAPQPVISLPDPDTQADNSRADRGQANSDIQTGIAVRNEGRVESQNAFDNTTKLKSSYEGLEPIKQYRTVVPILMDALDTPPNATGDNALIYAYAKIMDPGSVVRESEMGMAASGASAIDATVANLKKQLGIEGGGQLPPEVRQRLKLQINNRAYQMRVAYLNQRKRYSEDAQAYGIDPARVIGPDDMTPFVDRYQQSSAREFGGGAAAQGGPGGGGQPGEEPQAYFGDEGPQYTPENPPPGQVFIGWAEANGQRFPQFGPDPRPTSFTQGVEEGVASAANAAQTYLEDMTGIGAAGDLLGMETPAEAARKGIADWRKESQYQPSMAGRITGDVIATLPAIAAKNPMLSGALGGSLMAEDPNNLNDVATSAGIGAAAGKVFDAAGNWIGGKLAARRAAKNATPTPAENYASAQDFGVDLSLADAGGRGAKVTERLLDAQPASAEALNVARIGKTDQLATAAGNVADTFGQEASFRSMGVTAQKGATGWMERFDKVAEKAYNAIPIKPQTPAAVDNTRAALRELTGGFESNPALREATQNPQLLRYRDALEKGGLSWEDLKAFRSTIGEQIGEALFSDGTRKSQLRALYGALSKDMETSAAQQGPAALRAFERANNLYREGQTRIDDVLTQFLGNDAKNNPEAAAALIQRIAKEGKAGSDITTLAELRKSLKPDEWGQVSNGMIRLLGHPANQEGRGFAAETFMRNYAGMAEESKNLLFGKGPLRENLDEFARVVGLVGKNDATRNVSNTAMGVSGITSSGLFGGIGAAIGGVPGALLGIAANHAAAAGAGKAWTNPAFVRWMTGFTKMAKAASANGGQIPAKAFNSQMGALGRVAATQSAIASDALGLQRQLIAQFEMGPQKLAADPSGRSADGESTTKEGAQR